MVTETLVGGLHPAAGTLVLWGSISHPWPGLQHIESTQRRSILQVPHAALAPQFHDYRSDKGLTETRLSQRRHRGYNLRYPPRAAPKCCAVVPERCCPSLAHCIFEHIIK